MRKRLAFRDPVSAGTIYLNAGKVSVFALKADYPGDATNDDSCTLVHLRGRRDGGASFALPIFDERATLGLPYSLNRMHTILTNREESLALNARV